MPEVILTYHVEQRCKQQGISVGRVRRIAASLPDGQGEVTWKEGGIRIIVKFIGDGKRLVVTVIGPEKLRRTQRRNRYYKGAGMNGRF